LKVRGIIRLRWASLGLVLMLVALWAFSAAFEFDFVRGGIRLSLAYGSVDFGWWDRPPEFGPGLYHAVEWDFGLRRPDLCLDNEIFPGVYNASYPFWLLVSTGAVVTLWLFWRTRDIPAEVRAQNPEFMRVWPVGVLVLILLVLGLFWLPSVMVTTLTIALLWREHRRPARARDRHPRSVRLRRVSVGMLLALLFTWVCSTRFHTALVHGEIWLELRCGSVEFGLDGDNSPWIMENEFGVRSNWCDGFGLPYFYNDGPPFGSYGYGRHDEYFGRIPLWLPVAVVGVVTLWLYRRTRGFPGGRCHRCGYDLTANVSGVCPECGTMLETQTVSRWVSTAADNGGVGKWGS
jgi:hypothetical protein